MTALLSVLVQLVSVAAAIYLGLHGQILSGIGLFTAVQLLHWLAEKFTHFLLAIHAQYFLNDEQKDLIGLQFTPGLLNYAPRGWHGIAVGVGLLYFVLSCLIIWLALSR